MEETIDELQEKLLELKVARDFKSTIKDTYNLIKRDTEHIPRIDQLEDNNKGLWVEHDESNFHKMFEGLLDYCADESEFETLDWNTVNYKVYGADYYQEKFPGFSEEVYEILAKSTEEENKLIDNRIPSLKIQQKETIVSFK
jgi:alpha-L-fucosidase